MTSHAHDTRQQPGGRSSDLSDEILASSLGTAATVTVRFTLPAEVDAEFASVVGDFNGWNPANGVMDRDDDGRFWRSVDVVPGKRYQYRFLLDGDRWVNGSADSTVANEFGGENAVLDLGVDPDRELAAARAQHADREAATDRADDAMAPLINNTGDDGGAATG
jgi:1,4-alpha-glucan branching enzyme